MFSGRTITTLEITTLHFLLAQQARYEAWWRHAALLKTEKHLAAESLCKTEPLKCRAGTRAPTQHCYNCTGIETVSWKQDDLNTKLCCDDCSWWQKAGWHSRCSGFGESIDETFCLQKDVWLPSVDGMCWWVGAAGDPRAACISQH